ncbi:MAG: radical SAM protein [Candidatus Gastranaerophilales bacterium]|nr:radical SAM protein [Candidatus Gastranaerophilales bacterium]
MFKKKVLHNVVWEITLKCNARCLHCGSSAGESREDELSHEEAINVCDQLAEAGCRNVNLIGGELFLRPDWKKIIQRLIEKNIEVSIITNGIALTADKIDFLADIKIQTLGISLDGGSPETNDHIRQTPGLFNKIFNTMEYVQQKKLNAVAITTLNKLNILELPLFREKLINSPFKAWQIQLASPHGRMKNDLFLDLFEYYISGLFFAQSRITVPMKQLAIICLHDFGYYSKVIPRHTSYSKWTGCSAGKHVLGIKSDGKVQGCLSIYNDEFNEGDLRQQSLSDIWNSKTLCKWNKRINRFLSLKEFCKKCEFGLVCLGGCSDIAYSLSQNVGENPQCYHAIEYYWKKASPRNKFEEIFREITQGHMDKSGILYLKSGEILSKELLENSDISDDRINLLKLIAIV